MENVDVNKSLLLQLFPTFFILQQILKEKFYSSQNILQ